MSYLFPKRYHKLKHLMALPFVGNKRTNTYNLYLIYELDLSCSYVL